MKDAKLLTALLVLLAVILLYSAVTNFGEPNTGNPPSNPVDHTQLERP